MRRPIRAASSPRAASTDYTLADGASSVDVPFVWTGANGVTIRRTYTFSRGDYVVKVRDEVVNAGSAPWQGFVYRQLSRVPRALVKKGPMSAEQYSFQGAAWYTSTDKYEKRKYDDFVDDGPLEKQVTGGWIGMLQHHFFAAWIPGANDTSTFSLATTHGHRRHAVRGPRNRSGRHRRPGHQGQHRGAPVGRPEAGQGDRSAERAGPGPRGRLQQLQHHGDDRQLAVLGAGEDLPAGRQLGLGDRRPGAC